MKYVSLSLICAFAGIAYGADSETQKPTIHESIDGQSFDGYELKGHPHYRFVGRHISANRIYYGAKGDTIQSICSISFSNKLVAHTLKIGDASVACLRIEEYMVKTCQELVRLYAAFNKFEHKKFEKAVTELAKAKQDLESAKSNALDAEDAKDDAQEEYDSIKASFLSSFGSSDK